MKVEFAICLEKAQQGDLEAQSELGCLYRMGLGVNKDGAQAANWYQKAAESGNIKAQFYLGRLYEAGLGIAKDEALAMQWYLKAAQDNQILAEALKTNTTLTLIVLSCNEIGDEGTHALAEALKTNTTLTSIYLNGNEIGADGTHALAKALKTNSTLTSIDLSENQIGSEGTQALAEALKTNSTLTLLNLSYNNIRIEGIQALAEALKTNITLVSIDLEDDPMESDYDDHHDEYSEALQHINTFCKRNEISTQVAELYALFLACFPTEAQNAYLHLKEVTTSSTRRPIVRFFQMAGKLPDDVLHGLAYHVYDQARDFIPPKAKASAANKLLKQLREEDSVNSKMKAK